MSIAPTGQATASALGHARISAVVEGVEGSVEIDVVEPPLPKTVVVPVLPPVARAIPNMATPSEPAVPVGNAIGRRTLLAARNCADGADGSSIVELTSEPPVERVGGCRRRVAE